MVRSRRTAVVRACQAELGSKKSWLMQFVGVTATATSWLLSSPSQYHGDGGAVEAGVGGLVRREGGE